MTNQLRETSIQLSPEEELRIRDERLQAVVLPSEAEQSQYWTIVRRTLDRVFHIDSSDAEGLAEALQDRLNNPEISDERTKEKIFQTEPLTTAADLAGQANEPLSAQNVADYLDIKSEVLGLDRSEMARLDALVARENELSRSIS